MFSFLIPNRPRNYLRFNFTAEMLPAYLVAMALYRIFSTGISWHATELHVRSHVTLESTPFALTLQNIRTN